MPLVIYAISARPIPLGGFAGQCRGTRGDLQRRAELVRAGAGLCKAPLGRDRPRGFSDRRWGLFFCDAQEWGGWGDWLSPFTVFFSVWLFSRAVWPTENGEKMGCKQETSGFMGIYATRIGIWLINKHGDVTNNHDGTMGIQWDIMGIINLAKMVIQVIQPIFVWDYSNEMDIIVFIEILRHNLRWFQGEIGSFRFVSVPGSRRFLAVRFLTVRFSVRGSVPEPSCIIHHEDFMQLRLN